jgi:hypothetical protein
VIIAFTNVGSHGKLLDGNSAACGSEKPSLAALCPLRSVLQSTCMRGSGTLLRVISGHSSNAANYRSQPPLP